MIQIADPAMVPIRKEIRTVSTQKSFVVILKQSSCNKTVYGSYSLPAVDNLITAYLRLLI